MYPKFPTDWIEDVQLVDEQTLLDHGPLSLALAITDDRSMILAAHWPTGSRYMQTWPGSARPARAGRLGEMPADATQVREIEAIWSQALHLAKAHQDADS